MIRNSFLVTLSLRFLLVLHVDMSGGPCEYGVQGHGLGLMVCVCVWWVSLCVGEGLPYR